MAPGAPDAARDLSVVAVRGGFTGIRVVAGDVERLARLVGEMALDLVEEAARCGVYAESADLVASAVLSPLTAARAVAAIVQVAAGEGGAARAGARLGLLAGGLQTAASAYRAVEDAQTAVWREIDTLGGFIVGFALPGAGLLGLAGAAAVASTSPRAAALLPGIAVDQGERLVAGHPQLVGHLLNGAGGFLAGVTGPVTVAAGGAGIGMLAAAVGMGASADGTLPLTSALVGSLFTPGRYRIARADRQPDPVPAPASLADLARLLKRVNHPADGWVDVHAVEVGRADGTIGTQYLLVLPGTEDWSLPWQQGGNDAVRDIGANAQLMARRRSELTRALPELLDRAGVPLGADVALVGHSQGGMVAVMAADDDALRARVHITDVITFAAPVGLLPPPRDVQVLSLENVRDVVPELDGAENPDRAGHVTVSFDGGQAAAGIGPVGHAHAMERYVDGAGLIDLSAARGDPALAHLLAGLRDRGVLAAALPGRAPVRTRRTRWVVTVDRGAGETGGPSPGAGEPGGPSPGAGESGGPPPRPRPPEGRWGREPGAGSGRQPPT